jgi:hypothetical protein
LSANGFQKVLVLILGGSVDRIGKNSFLEGRGSPALPGKGRKRPGCPAALLLCHLELGGGDTLHYHLAPFPVGWGGALEPRGGQSRPVPGLACLQWAVPLLCFLLYLNRHGLQPRPGLLVLFVALCRKTCTDFLTSVLSSPFVPLLLGSI